MTMYNNNNRNRNGGKNFNRPAPAEPTELQVMLTELLMDQLDHYKAELDIPSDETRERNNQLFNLGSFKKHLMDDLVAYQVERKVFFDRETGDLKRASVSIVVMDEKYGSIEYYCNGFLNERLGGNIVVTPIKERGPVTRDSYKTNIKPE